MMKRHNGSRILSFVSAAAVAASMCAAPAFAASDSGNMKDETVYVITDDQGQEQDVIVSDHLFNADGNDTISDVSKLKDIENVKGEEKFDRGKNGKITWKADGNDIYYEGRTDEEVPVEMEVSYYLDGEKISGKDLQGKDGKVKIVLKFRNNAETTVDGKTVKVPFAVISGLIVEDDSYANVKVSSGKVIDDGQKQFIAGLAMPGLSDSTGIPESTLGIGDTITIEGDASGFSVDDIMTVVSSGLFEDMGADLPSLDMDGQIDQLDSAAKALMKGSGTLYRGVNMLAEQSGAMADGVGQLNDGAQKLNGGMKDAAAGSAQLQAGSAQLSQKLDESLGTMKGAAAQLEAGSGQIYGGLTQVQSGINGEQGLMAGMDQLVAGLKGYAGNPGVSGYMQKSIQVNKALRGQIEAVKDKLTPEEYAALTAYLDTSDQIQQGVAGTVDGQIIPGAEKIDGGLRQVQGALNGAGTKEDPGLVGGAKAVHDGTLQLQGGLGQATASDNSLTSGAADLAKGAAALADGQKQAAGGASKLAEGMSTLDGKTGMLISGVGKLDMGAKALSDGMGKFYREGISKIVSLYNGTFKNAAGNAEAIIKAGKQYDIFTEAGEGTDSSVKFIYRTQVDGE